MNLNNFFEEVFSTGKQTTEALIMFAGYVMKSITEALQIEKETLVKKTTKDNFIKTLKNILGVSYINETINSLKHNMEKRFQEIKNTPDMDLDILNEIITTKFNEHISPDHVCACANKPDLEKLLTELREKNEKLEERIAKLEKNKKENEIQVKTNLELELRHNYLLKFGVKIPWILKDKWHNLKNQVMSKIKTIDEVIIYIHNNLENLIDPEFYSSEAKERIILFHKQNSASEKKEIISLSTEEKSISNTIEEINDVSSVSEKVSETSEENVEVSSTDTTSEKNIEVKNEKTEDIDILRCVDCNEEYFHEKTKKNKGRCEICQAKKEEKKNGKKNGKK